MRIVGIMILATFFAGCAGVITMHNTSTEVENLNFKLAGKGFLNRYVKEHQNYTKSSVLSVWGEPDEKTVNGTEEKWRYNQGSLAWAGAIPMLIIVPIPLVAPVGKNGVLLNFQNENLVGAVTEQRDVNIAMCGYFLMDHPSEFKAGCFSDFGDNGEG